MARKYTLTEQVCKRCGCSTLGNKKRKYCPPCKSIVQLARKNAAYAVSHPEVEKFCETCGDSIGTSPFRRYCAACVRQNRKTVCMAKYGLTATDFDRMYTQQDGQCAICGVHPNQTLHVDHDHLTGRVRGLLCQDCNLALGRIKDSITTAAAMVQYLAQFKE